MNPPCEFLFVSFQVFRRKTTSSFQLEDRLGRSYAATGHYMASDDASNLFNEHSISCKQRSQRETFVCDALHAFRAAHDPEMTIHSSLLQRATSRTAIHGQPVFMRNHSLPQHFHRTCNVVVERPHGYFEGRGNDSQRRQLGVASETYP